MPVDEHDERPDRREDEPGDDAPVKFTKVEGEGEAPTPLTPRGRRARWRRIVNRRNAMWTGIAAVSLVILAIIVALILYRSGQIDRIIARQITDTFAKYGVRAEIGSFETKFGPRTAELRDVKLYDAQTGARIGEIDRMLATVRIEDMWALNLRREVNLESLEIDGLELWVTFDEQGRSNLANLRLPEPEPNQRILFSYSTAHIKLTNAVIHYDDRQHSLSGEARNLRATIWPEDPNAPEESRMNLFEIALSDSTFVYDGRPINEIDIEARGRANQTRAEINELILRSPVTEARLEGTLDDWRALRYQMRVNATVDLTQVSEVLQPETTLRGAGRFVGTVSGEGERYHVEGEITSEALAADGVRLQGLNVNAAGGGEGESYELQGRAVAELLTAGDFRLNSVQLAGGVTGTGTDFRWLGEMRAAALRSGQTSIAGLILRDAAANLSESRVEGSAGSASADSVVFEGGRARGLRASGLRFRRASSGETRLSAEGARVDSVAAGQTNVSGVQASGIDATINADESAQLTVEQMRVGAVKNPQATTGALNVAGVRLSISPGGVVEGTTGDINVGTVALQDGGRAEQVRLARPRFTLAPSGSYRASADLSLGGGVLGQMRLGAVRGHVVATTTQVQLNDFVAEIFNGRARGSAAIATAGGAPSRVAADFEGVDVGGLVATVAGRVVPITGAATGNVNLSFPGMNYKAASGTLNAQFSGETGQGDTGRTPLTGDLSVQAERGLFRIERASLHAGATDLDASGQFSFEGSSDLNVNLASRDAAELQRVVVSTGFVPELEAQLEKFGIELGGTLNFNGTLRGPLKNPLVNGRFELASLGMRGIHLGALSANIESTEAEMRVANGQLVEPDGGGARFTAVIPRAGENNISVEATLENVNAGNLLAALGPGKPNVGSGETDEGGTLIDPASLAGMGPLSGSLSVTGLPGAMNGSADLSAGPGVIGGEPYREFAARATFGGTRINVEELSVQFEGGAISASGGIDLDTQQFDLNARGEQVRLDLLTRLFGGGRNLPKLEGVADFTANISGSNFNDASTYRAQIDALSKGVIVNGQPAGDLVITGRTSADNRFTLELKTGLLGTEQIVRAEINLADESLPTTIETNLAGADLTPLFKALMPPQTNVRVTGRATGSLRATGNLVDVDTGAFSLGGLQGRAEFTELVVQVEDVPLAADNPLIVLFSSNQVTFERTRFVGPGTDITIGGTAAMGPGGQQNMDVGGSLNLRVVKLSPNTFLGGTARVNVKVAGSYEDPQITGLALVENGSFATLIEDERIQVTQVNARVRFNADQAQIETLTGRLGGGHITASGGARLDGFVPTQYRLSVHGEGVTVPFPEDFRTTADANIEVRGTEEGQIIAGVVSVRRAEYTEDIDIANLIDNRRELTIEEGIGGVQGFGQTTLDLQIEGRDALVVRNNLGEIVGSISLRARGPSDDPVISGRITATRGTVNFRNNRFEIQRAIIDLPPRRGADPIVNILTEGEIRGYRVRVGVSGPLSGGMQTTLSADPPLPQGDVVSLITTGNLSTGDQSTSILSQSGVGTATSLLADTLINAPVRRATDKLFGLNRFEIDPLIVGRGGASPTARLTVGRQVNRNLAITYSTNVTGEPNQVLAVEYRVSDRLSFVAQYQQGSQNTLRTQNNDFSFEVRFRKRY